LMNLLRWILLLQISRPSSGYGWFEVEIWQENSSTRRETIMYNQACGGLCRHYVHTSWS
jgi:hypothetical protein